MKGASISVEAPYIGLACPYGSVSDQLWVRETFQPIFKDEYFESDLVPDYKTGEGYRIHYLADGPAEEIYDVHKEEVTTAAKPSIFMPRWASRITLEITQVRVERLQDISEHDSISEGCEAAAFPGPWWQGYKNFDGELVHQQYVGESPPDWMIEPKRMKSVTHLDRTARDAYRLLWAQINGLESWDANPWVWAITFKRITPCAS